MITHEVKDGQNWLTAAIQDANGTNVCSVGSLRMEGDTALLAPQICSFVEVYGSDSAMPAVTVSFHTPSLNGHAIQPSSVLVNYPENGVPHAPRFAAVAVVGDSVEVEVTPTPFSGVIRQQTLTFGIVR